VSLGEDASVTAGPVEHAAEASGANAAPATEVLAYSRARDSVTGANVSGAIVRTDQDADHDVYGVGATPRTILASRALSAPTQATPFLAALRGGASTEIARGDTETPPAAAGAAPSGASSAPTISPAADGDVRRGIADLQRSIDRLIADANAGERAVATAGARAAPGTIPVSRERLLALRRQVTALLATLDKQP
jgi:hypothetical protein